MVEEEEKEEEYDSNKKTEHVFYDVEKIDPPLVFVNSLETENTTITTVINRKGKMVGSDSDVYFCTVAEKLDEVNKEEG